MVDNYKKYIEEVSKRTGFIKSTLEKVDRLLNILEWINNHEKLSESLVLKGGTAINTVVFNFPRLSVDIDLDFTNNLTKDEMIKERDNIHSLMVQYLNSNNYKINIEKSKNMYALDSIVAEYENINRNPKKNSIDEMKHAVRKYLKDILIIDDNIKIFYDKFQNGMYEPELLFDNEEIIKRIKEHPMITWKLKNI